MDPATTGWAALGGLISLLVSAVGFMKYRRNKREKLAQAQADEMREAIKRADAGLEPPLTGVRVVDDKP